MLGVGARGWVGVGLGWFQRGFVGEEAKKKKKRYEKGNGSHSTIFLEMRVSGPILPHYHLKELITTVS